MGLWFGDPGGGVHVDGIIPGEPVLGGELAGGDAHELIEGIGRHGEDQKVTDHYRTSNYGNHKQTSWNGDK